MPETSGKTEGCSKETEDTKKNQMNLWDCNKSSNIHAIRIPDGEVRLKKHSKKKKIVEKFSKLAKDINLQIKAVEQTPKKINSKIHTKTHHSQTSEN